MNKENIKTINERIKFIQELELDIPIGDYIIGKRQFHTSDIPSAAVDGASLQSFVANLDFQGKSDVLNSTLLGQLAANKKFNREEKPEEWYNFYKSVLENVGWVLQEFNFNKYNASTASFETSKAIIEVLSALCTGNEILIVKSAIDALNALKTEDNRVTIFEQNSHSLKKGNFQISICNQQNRQITMKVGCFYFDTSENIVRVLWHKFNSSKCNMYSGGQVITLNEDIYSRVRDSVIKKLGDNALKFIDNLDI